jgi:hypothetical protein
MVTVPSAAMVTHGFMTTPLPVAAGAAMSCRPSAMPHVNPPVPTMNVRRLTLPERGACVDVMAQASRAAR